MRRGVRAEEENETLLTLVLEKLTKRETALLTDAVQLSLRVHTRRDAARERKSSEKGDRPHFIAPTNFSKR